MFGGSKENWVVRGKSITQLIKELRTFENQDLVVEVSLDGGITSQPISLVGKLSGKCVLLCLNEPND